MEIVVKGRRCEVSDRFREFVEDKLSKFEKFDHRIILIDVEVTQEHNPRLADNAIRVEITVRSRGPVMRSEASSSDKQTALDKALAKLEARMRRAAERRRAHRDGHRRRAGVLVASDVQPAEPPTVDGVSTVSTNGTGTSEGDVAAWEQFGDLTVIGDGPVVVREKDHRARPMSIEQALYEMELVGHDFFLFVDEEDSRPAVVYKRRGYAYGVIRLSGPEEYRRAGSQ